MAHELLKGLSMPYWQYRADDFGGGSLVIGVVIALFFKLFGESVFVLRSSAIFISLGALLVWFQILSRNVSRKCAWYFALFFIFAPTSFQSLSMVPLGDHYETIFLSALAVAMMLRILQGRNFRGEIILLGIFCGFGVWFAYMFAITVAALVIVWFFKNPRVLSKPDFWMFAAGFVVGFSPWIYTNYRTHFGGLYIMNQPILSYISLPHPAEGLSRYLWRTCFLRDVFDAFSHTDIGFPASGFLINWIYVFLLTAPLLILFFLNLEKGRKNIFFTKPHSDISFYFLVYAVIHCAALQLTSFEGRRYVAPLMPAIFYVWARMMESLESFSIFVMKASRKFFAAPLLGLSVLLWFLMISPAHAGLLFKTQGFAYDYAASIPACTSYKGVDPCTQIALKLPREDRSDLERAEAESLADTVANPVGGMPFENVVFPTKEFAAAFYFHYGEHVFYAHNNNIRTTFAFLRETVDQNSTAFDLCLLGMFHAYGFEDLDVMQFLVREFPSKFSEGYFKAIGRQAASYWWGPRTKINEIVERRWRKSMDIRKIYMKIKETFPSDLTPKERAAFFKGLGGFFIRNTYRQPIRGYEDFIRAKELFLPADLEAFFQGVGQFEEISFEFSIASCRTWSHEYMTDQKDPEIQTWIEEGRQEIKNLLGRFYQEYQSNPSAGKRRLE